jgi:hypothetical protein
MKGRKNLRKTMQAMGFMQKPQRKRLEAANITFKTAFS